MIQRIQSLYVSIVVALSFLMLHGNIATFIGEEAELSELKYDGFYRVVNAVSVKEEGVLPLSVILAVVPVIALITLLLFRFRRLQLRASVLTLLLLLGEVLILAWYIFYYSARFDLTVVFNIKITFPVVSAVLMYLAFRGILKDELLVRSYNRIR